MFLSPIVALLVARVAQAAPSVVAINPPSASNGGSASLVITGTGFDPASTVVLHHSGSQPDIPGAVTNATASEIDATFDLTAVAPSGSGNTWSLIVTNPDNSQSSGSAFTITNNGGAPTVTSASPSSRGQGASTQNITINGTRFAHGFGVAFTGTGTNGITVNSTTFISATQVIVNISVSSDATAASRIVTVTNTDGVSGACTNCFTVNASPTVSSASPSTVGNNGSSSITFTGSGFVNGANVKLKKSGQTDIPASSNVFNSGTSISSTFNLTGAAPGTWDIVVTNGDGGVGTCTNCLTIAGSTPTVTSASPASLGAGASSKDITIAGTKFANGAVASFGGSGITVNSTNFVSTTQVVANITVDSGADQTARNVTVTNTDSLAGTCTSCFTVTNAPAANSITPSSRYQGEQNQDLVIAGNGFDPAATVSFSGSGVTINTTNVGSSSQITVNVNIAQGAATGLRTVTVTNPDTKSGTCACFTVNQSPVVTSASPSSRGEGATNENITISGSSFVNGASVSFSNSDITVNQVTFNGPTSLTAKISIFGTSPGASDIMVSNPPVNGDTGSYTCSGCFTVTAAPTTTSASPNNLGQGASERTVTLSGSDFVSGATVVISNTNNDVTASSPTVAVNGNSMTVKVTVASNAATGARDITVTNPDHGTFTCTGCFTVNAAPTVTSTSPSAGNNDGTVVVTINGTGMQSGAAAILQKTNQNDINGSPVVVAGDGNSLTATFDLTNVAPGPWSVKVVNSDGGSATCSCSFTVAASAPTVTSASPPYRPGLSNKDVTVTGTNFARGAAVTFNGSGITVNTTTWNSTTSLTANITTAPDATTDARDVTVTNTDAQSGTCTGCYTLTPSPTATSVSPAALAKGVSSQTFTVTGSGFDTGATVSFSPATGITQTGSPSINGDHTQITVTISVGSGADSGAHDVVVTNSTDGSTATCSACFAVDAAPTISTVSPAALAQGASSQTVTITGTGFASGATVSFSPDPSDITVGTPTVAGDGNSITVPVSIASSATPEAHDLTVTNTDLGTVTKTSALTVNAKPTLTSVSPASLGQGATSQTLTLTGTSFAGVPTVSVDGTGITLGTPTRVSGTQITVPATIASDATTENRTFTVTNTDTDQGVATCTCFHVNAKPAASSVSPSSRGQGVTSQDLTITGTAFGSGATVSFSPATGITINSTTVNGATSITVNVTIASDAPTTARDVTVDNHDAGSPSTCTGCFTIHAKPSVTGISPASFKRGATNQSVTVTGTGFLSGATLSFSPSGVTVVSQTVSATQISAHITVSPSTTDGPRDVRVTNADGGVGSCPACFTISAPFNAVTTGGFGSSGANWNLVNRNASTVASGERTQFNFGRSTDFPVVGDWDGNGTMTIGVVRGSTWYLRNTNSGGAANITFNFGRSTDEPIVGDWDGNGTWTPGVKRGNVWYLRNSNTPGPSDIVITFGRADDDPVVGDWDGDGDFTIGVHRGTTYYLRNTNSNGPSDITFGLGRVTDIAVVGDWDGDGTWTAGLLRPETGVWYLKNHNDGSPVDLSFLAQAEGVVLVGDWDGLNIG